MKMGGLRPWANHNCTIPGNHIRPPPRRHPRFSELPRTNPTRRIFKRVGHVPVWRATANENYRGQNGLSLVVLVLVVVLGEFPAEDENDDENDSHESGS